jgi:ubiquinone/menaquinone biosynthesis C-methylase UbiE
MHSRIYQEFERICTERPIRGSVLEVGATATDESLLDMKSLQQASERIGIDLTGPHVAKGYKILKGNSNSMDCFQDNQFDAVLCHAVLEHDKYFWKTVSEIKRVAKPGGLIVIGVPGYSKVSGEKIKGLWARMPLVRRLQSHQYLNMLFTSTLTYEIHDWPGDYYRFSPQAVREVILEGLEQIEVRTIMLPPRVIGIGTKSVSG